MRYVLIVNTVHDRGDLLERTLRSMLPQLDLKPARIIVHEDVRPAYPFVEGLTEDGMAEVVRDHGVPIELLRTNPGAGMARGLLKMLEAADTEFVFYSQEDFDFVRPVPIARCLEIMTEHELHHVRFNKRKTMRIKGEHRPPHEQFKKVEVTIGGQVFCISDRWYHQASVWRRQLAARGYRALVEAAAPGKPVERPEDRFDHWINQTIGGGVGSVDGGQEARRELCRTFIWGGVGEPAFISHTGSERSTQGRT
ncbi:MAG TPA: hypothetical protein VIA18_20695 [Polyangia bacterium]|nr:hypothetical protein [Polyangia bacterium]